uniref:Uncharacterized protein n=1 Tax=Anguilla anguilla TaxID=7936 RepID=A0A0E9RBR3_ANGAN
MLASEIYHSLSLAYQIPALCPKEFLRICSVLCLRRGEMWELLLYTSCS